MIVRFTIEPNSGRPGIRTLIPGKGSRVSTAVWPAVDDPASVVLLDHCHVRKVPGEGIEPSSSASKAGGLPLVSP